MKKLLAVSAVVALGLSSVGFAGGLPEEMPVAPAAVSSDAGVYVGLSGGYGMTGFKNQSDAAKKDNGVVGRAFLGYDIVRNFAIEAGYSYFFNKVEFVPGTQSVKSTQAIDLMLKLKAPVVDGFDLFAKVGGNYLMTNVKKGDNLKNFNVAYGFGADYSITPNIIASVEWLRFNGKAKFAVDANKYQPSTDAFLIGLRYKFDL